LLESGLPDAGAGEGEETGGVLGDVVHAQHEPLCRVTGLSDDVGVVLNGSAHDLGKQPVLRLEMPVYERMLDTGAVRDVSDCHVRGQSRPEQVSGRRQDALLNLFSGAESATLHPHSVTDRLHYRNRPTEPNGANS